jgi:hypothetical protein
MSDDEIAANIETLAIAGVEVDTDLFTTEVLAALPPAPITSVPGSSVPVSSVPGTSAP